MVRRKEFTLGGEKMSKLITGTLVQSYSICKRQAWLMAHQVIPDQENTYIELGRIFDEETYGRDKKKVNFENVVLDLIRSNEEDLVIGEVKKSSKAEKSAKMQLLFYLYKLNKAGIKAKGMLLFPKERKKIFLELTKEEEVNIEKMCKDIEKIILQPFPPPFKKIGYCKNCGYKEFCLS